MNIKTRATNDARALREATLGGPFVPVDPVVIAKMLGLDVLLADLPDNVSGALIKMEGHDPAIFLNRMDAPNRQRFTCAHELGHYVSRVNSDDGLSYEFVDMRGELAAAGTDPEEVYANAFAAELLMPEDVVRDMVKSGMPPALISARLQVSDDAIRIRMKTLGR
ncbi:MAG: ImmA/IrrE family metallo-endopeptidase [Pseudomonadota bacterium]